MLAAYVVLTALFTGIGLLITGPLENGSVVRLDERVARWFANRRTDPMNTLSLIGSNLAETWTKVLVTLIVAIVMMRMWRRWYEAAVISVALILEASVFVTVTTLVGRDRPDVPRLDSSPIGSSFPSGHVAAAMAYSAIAVVVFWHTRNRLARLLMAAACVLIPIAVGLARMYRGMHFLSDVTAGALLGGACVIVTVWIMQRSPEASVVKSGQEVEDGRVDGLGVGEVGRVSARHGDDTAAAAQAGRQHLGLLHLDRGVVVPWTTRAGQVISPSRPVMSSRPCKQFDGSSIASFGRLRHLAIHFGFSSASSMMSVATGLARSSMGPTASHVSTIPCSSASRSGSGTPDSVSSRINARTRSGDVERGAQRQEAALTHPTDDGTVDPEMVEQTEAVGGRVPVAERLAVELGVAEPTLVPRDHAIAVAQRVDLWGEHLVVHEEAVGEDHRRAGTTGVFEVDVLTVDRCVWHGAKLAVWSTRT